MMRIKESIQRRKLIHEMNEEYKEFDFEAINFPVSPVLLLPCNEFESDDKLEPKPSTENALQPFVQYLSGKLTDSQKRALKVTWRRLSEAPKTSGRGTIIIMEKVLSKVCESEPHITSIFYRSAFLSCIEDRRCRRSQGCSIATIRDHAHILVEYINAIINTMFKRTCSGDKQALDPEKIGAVHARLAPLGFDRKMWHVLGECFAEVMFNQECVRAFPHAPSAWSLLSIAMTDKMFTAGRQHPSWLRIDRPFPCLRACSSLSCFGNSAGLPGSCQFAAPKLSLPISLDRSGDVETVRECLCKLSCIGPRERNEDRVRSPTTRSDDESTSSLRETIIEPPRRTTTEPKQFFRSKFEGRFMISSPRTTFV